MANVSISQKHFSHVDSLHPGVRYQRHKCWMVILCWNHIPSLRLGARNTIASLRPRSDLVPAGLFTAGTDENLFRLVIVPGHGARVLPLELVPVPWHVSKLVLGHQQKSVFRLMPVPRHSVLKGALFTETMLNAAVVIHKTHVRLIIRTRQSDIIQFQDRGEEKQRLLAT